MPYVLRLYALFIVSLTHIKGFFLSPVPGLFVRFKKAIGAGLSLINHVDLVGLGVHEDEEVVAEKLHLQAGILGIHGLHIELLRADNLDVLALGVVALQELRLEGTSSLVLVYDLVLILAELALNNLLNQVDGDIHIVTGLLGPNDGALHRDGDLIFWRSFSTLKVTMTSVSGLK